MPDIIPNCDVCTIIPTIADEFIIYEGSHWIANLRDTDQTLLGTSFVTLKRHAPELDYLTADEDQEFIIIRNSLIKAIRQSFQPITFNVSCLKNDAFRQEPNLAPPESSHVHWHLKPRYRSEPKEFSGELFTDPEPGKYLSNNFRRHKPSNDVAVNIASIIKQNFIL